MSGGGIGSGGGVGGDGGGSVVGSHGGGGVVSGHGGGGIGSAAVSVGGGGITGVADGGDSGMSDGGEGRDGEDLRRNRKLRVRQLAGRLSHAGCISGAARATDALEESESGFV